MARQAAGLMRKAGQEANLAHECDNNMQADVEYYKDTCIQGVTYT